MLITNQLLEKKIVMQIELASFHFFRWAANSCAMDSLYDLDLMSNTVPVILDNSKMWYRVLSTSMKLGARGLPMWLELVGLLSETTVTTQISYS